jgi:mono/diheme cytochrome c family protein
MKKVTKLIAYLAIAIVLIVIAVVSYVTLALPNVGEPENIKVEVTQARIDRGKYLASSVAVCLDCHSPRDWTKFGGPIDSTRLGAGGEKFDAGAGFPGDVTVPNITPFNLKNWTDGELFRAITTGVKKDGSAIFPLMPWPYYSKMDREDIYAIIAYIRTLKPVEATYAKSKLDFPLNILVHTMPKKATLGTKPDPRDTLKYGEYLVQTAACKECHSQDNKGELLPGLEFAGGREFRSGNAVVRSANITTDAATGIGRWTKQEFVAKFKMFADNRNAHSVGKTDFQTAMPWWQYGKMSEGDIASIYTYLRTIKPVSHTVVKFEVN